MIKAVDKFVFYDDVNFINRGWINRNRIIINNTTNYITVQLIGASQNKLINEVEFIDNRQKLNISIEMAYKKAPFFTQVMPVIKNISKFETNSISNLAIYSVKEVCKYLQLKTKFEISSLNYSETKGLEKSNRLITICKQNMASTYINPIGGQELYNKEYFRNDNIELFFIKTNLSQYKQFNKEFIPGLSILDVMMFNSIKDIHKMLDNYELI